MNKPELIKICGLSTPEAIDAVIDGGASHLGFIFFEKSPRHITLETAKLLSNHVAGRAKKVAVSVNAEQDYLEAINEALEPDLMQLHGSETIERVQEIKDRFALPVIKALAIQTEDNLEAAKSYIGTADHFLFDAKAPKGSEIPGGNGVAFDWEIMDAWPQAVPYILSGGLNKSNVKNALNRLSVYGLDISSGVETTPGKKDVTLIREFLRTIG